MSTRSPVDAVFCAGLRCLVAVRNCTQSPGRREIMRRYAGIYALYRRKHLYYIGLTTNLLGPSPRSARAEVESVHCPNHHVGLFGNFDADSVQLYSHPFLQKNSSSARLLAPRAPMTK